MHEQVRRARGQSDTTGTRGGGQSTKVPSHGTRGISFEKEGFFIPGGLRTRKGIEIGMENDFPETLSGQNEKRGENGADEEDASIQFRWLQCQGREDRQAERQRDRPRTIDDRSSVYYGIRGSKM